MRPGFNNNRIVLPRRATVYAASQLFFTRGLYAMIGVRGDGGSSGSSAIRRRLGPRLYLPPPKPRAVLSAMHPSKDAEHAQPKASVTVVGL